jgi:hypothetical protein
MAESTPSLSRKAFAHSLISEKPLPDDRPDSHPSLFDS